MKKIYNTLLLVSLFFAVHAQVEENLNLNHINATFSNLKSHFNSDGNAAFEVPKNSGKHAMYALGLWFMGYDVNNQLRGFTQEYQSLDPFFSCGPLKINGDDIATTTTEVSELFNTIWKVDKKVIEEFKKQFSLGNISNGNYSIPEEIETWPGNGPTAYGNYAQKLAPYIDFNSDGAYNPEDGDYPDISGDLCLYWILNSAHLPGSGMASLGCEIHGMAYAYVNSNPENEIIETINNTVFLNYTIINRSTNSIQSLSSGIFLDGDIGDSSDDYTGTHVDLNSVYFYNGDEMDGSGEDNSYGANPPAIGIVFLPSKNTQTNHNLNTSLSFSHDNPNYSGEPGSAIDYYNYLNGIWLDNTLLTYGGNGYASSETFCKFIYPGTSDPAGIGTDGITMPPWSEVTESNMPMDQKMIASIAPTAFNSGDTLSINLGLIWSRADTKESGTLAQLFTDIEVISDYYNSDSFPSNYSTISNPRLNQTNHNFIFPNPVTETLYFNNISVETYTYEIYSATGILINTGEINASNSLHIKPLIDGLYVLKLYGNEATYIQKFVKH